MTLKNRRTFTLFTSLQTDEKLNGTRTVSMRTDELTKVIDSGPTVKTLYGGRLRQREKDSNHFIIVQKLMESMIFRNVLLSETDRFVSTDNTLYGNCLH